MDDELKKLYTCVICYNLFDEATALRKCRHIFCWKCIHGKITQHNWHCCPICYEEFGPDPLMKLRHDDPLLLSMETENSLSEHEEETESDEDYEEESDDEDDEESEDEDMEGSKDEDDDEATESDDYEYMEAESESDDQNP